MRHQQSKYCCLFFGRQKADDLPFLYDCISGCPRCGRVRRPLRANFNSLFVNLLATMWSTVLDIKFFTYKVTWLYSRHSTGMIVGVLNLTNWNRVGSLLNISKRLSFDGSGGLTVYVRNQTERHCRSCWVLYIESQLQWNSCTRRFNRITSFTIHFSNLIDSIVSILWAHHAGRRVKILRYILQQR